MQCAVSRELIGYIGCLGCIGLAREPKPGKESQEAASASCHSPPISRHAMFYAVCPIRPIRLIRPIKFAGNPASHVMPSAFPVSSEQSLAEILSCADHFPSVNFRSAEIPVNTSVARKVQTPSGSFSAILSLNSALPLSAVRLRFRKKRASPFGGISSAWMT